MSLFRNNTTAPVFLFLVRNAQLYTKVYNRNRFREHSTVSDSRFAARLCCKIGLFLSRVNFFNAFFFSIVSADSYPLLGWTRSRGRCWAAIRLCRHSEPSGHTLHWEIDGLHQGFPSVLLRCTPLAFCQMSMHPFSISTNYNVLLQHLTDEHVPLKFLMTKCFVVIIHRCIWQSLTDICINIWKEMVCKYIFLFYC